MRQGSAKVDAVRIAGMLLPGCFGGFSAHLGTAALALCVNRILARVLLLHQLAVAIGLDHLLAHFGTRQGWRETGVGHNNSDCPATAEPAAANTAAAAIRCLTFIIFSRG